MRKFNEVANRKERSSSASGFDGYYYQRKNLQKYRQSDDRLTLPSYSRRDRISGAMYAGVPTVDLGRECSSSDC